MNSKLDLAGEASVGFFEWVLIIVIVLLASIYLWRKYFVKKGCAGCTSSRGRNACSMQINPKESPICSLASDTHQQSEQPMYYQEELPLKSTKTPKPENTTDRDV